MTGVYESPKPRINASLLSQYIGRPVCFVGRLEKVHPSGKALTLSDGEGKSASVELNDPVSDQISTLLLYYVSYCSLLRRCCFLLTRLAG
uniref:Replication protein A 14 kDa subunit n=1 Tax=Sinocyclocheilus grahami TaxID=75366 RepID=A0A672KD25_SINGR